MTLKVAIDLNICSGTSNCAEEAEDVYAINDRGLAYLRPGTHSDEAILAGARSCPVDAIKVFDASGKQIHP